jgi:hypothetical protein
MKKKSYVNFPYLTKAECPQNLAAIKPSMGVSCDFSCHEGRLPILISIKKPDKPSMLSYTVLK